MFHLVDHTKASRLALGGAVFCMMTALAAQLRSEERSIGKAQLNLATVLSPSLVNAVSGQVHKPISPNVFRTFGASSSYLTAKALTAVSTSEVLTA